MTKKHLNICSVLFMLFLSSCIALGDSGSNRIIGKYIVVWIDVPENQSISEEVEMNSPNSTTVVPEYVYALGHNNNYIIAKQHPTSSFDGGFAIDTKTTNYFIVDINRKTLKRNDKVFGPLKQREFDSLRSVLKIESIEFDQKYPDKP